MIDVTNFVKHYITIYTAQCPVNMKWNFSVLYRILVYCTENSITLIVYKYLQKHSVYDKS